MVLKKRGKIYQLGYVDPQTGIYRRVSSGCTDKTAAESWLRSFERRLHDPVHAAAAEYRLKSALDTMLTWAEVKEKKHPKTLRYLANHGRQMLRVFAQLTRTTHELGPALSAINAPVVDKYCLTRLEEGIAHLTIYKELCTLRKTLKKARRDGVYGLDPETVIPEWKADYIPRTQVLTREQADKLLEVLPPKRAAHIAFFLGTAARYGETTRARRSHFHWDRETVFIPGTKTKASKCEIPIVPFLKPYLDRALRDAPGDDVLFLPWGSYIRDLHCACDKAGVPHITANDLRRSVVTWMMQAGIPAEFAISVTRHTDTKMIRTVYNQSTASDMVRHIKNALDLAKGVTSVST